MKTFTSFAAIKRLLLIAGIACLQRNMPGQTSPWTPDPQGDAKKGGPDLVATAVVSSNGILTLRARFDIRSFDARTTRVAWILDTDQNPATGAPGLFGAPGVRASGVYVPVDGQLIGADAVAVLTGVCNSGSLMSYDRQVQSWPLADSLPSVAYLDGFDAYVALDSIQKSDPAIRFKVVAYKFSGECPPRSVSFDVQDVAPDVTRPPAAAAEGHSVLSRTQPVAPQDGSTFESFPRKTLLRWTSVPGAAAYLVQVQYEDPTTANGWRPLVFRRVPDTTAEFDFVGAQAGRWRVWALDQDGLAGEASTWLTFRYSR